MIKYVQLIILKNIPELKIISLNKVLLCAILFGYELVFLIFRWLIFWWIILIRLIDSYKVVLFFFNFKWNHYFLLWVSVFFLFLPIWYEIFLHWGRTWLEITFLMHLLFLVGTIVALTSIFRKYVFPIYVLQKFLFFKVYIFLIFFFTTSLNWLKYSWFSFDIL